MNDPAAIIATLRKNLDGHRAEEDRNQLAGTSPDTAFELGYAAAIFDLRELLFPDWAKSEIF